MRLALVCAVGLCAAAGAGAQTTARSPQRPAGLDSVGALDALVRARGDTLWYTLVAAGPLTGPRETSGRTQTILVGAADATLIVGDRRVRLPSSMARIFRDFYRQAQACPHPAEGCRLDSALLSNLGAP